MARYLDFFNFDFEDDEDNMNNYIPKVQKTLRDASNPFEIPQQR